LAEVVDDQGGIQGDREGLLGNPALTEPLDHLGRRCRAVAGRPARGDDRRDRLARLAHSVMPAVQHRRGGTHDPPQPLLAFTGC
jgi:hypothetical protein